MSTPALTNEERELLAKYQKHAEDIAKLAVELNRAGISVTFSVNPMEGKIDRFDVFRSIKIDMKSGAN